MYDGTVLLRSYRQSFVTCVVAHKSIKALHDARNEIIVGSLLPPSHFYSFSVFGDFLHIVPLVRETFRLYVITFALIVAPCAVPAEILSVLATTVLVCLSNKQPVLVCLPQQL